MSVLETKVVRKKKVDKDLNLRVLKNDASERIFVEFASRDGKLILQKSFQDTYLGQNQAKEFELSINSLEDLRKYFSDKSRSNSNAN